MPTKVILPHLGESVLEGTIGQWLKQEGSQVAETEPLLEVTTDKVNVEIPSPEPGILLQILVPEGETVKVGAVLAWIGQPGEEVINREQPGPAKQPTSADIIPHTPMRLAIAEHMLHSKRVSPHVTTVMEADLSQIVSHR